MNLNYQITKFRIKNGSDLRIQPLVSQSWTEISLQLFFNFLYSLIGFFSNKTKLCYINSQHFTPRFLEKCYDAFILLFGYKNVRIFHYFHSISMFGVICTYFYSNGESYKVFFKFSYFMKFLLDIFLVEEFFSNDSRIEPIQKFHVIYNCIISTFLITQYYMDQDDNIRV